MNRWREANEKSSLVIFLGKSRNLQNFSACMLSVASEIFGYNHGGLQRQPISGEKM